MAKQKNEEAPVEGQGASEATATAEAAPKARKRTASKYQLVRQLEKAEGDKGARFEVVAAGTTVKAMAATAATMADGKYAIISVRSVLEVVTATAKVVNKIK